MSSPPLLGTRLTSETWKVTFAVRSPRSLRQERFHSWSSLFDAALLTQKSIPNELRSSDCSWGIQVPAFAVRTDLRYRSYSRGNTRGWNWRCLPRRVRHSLSQPRYTITSKQGTSRTKPLLPYLSIYVDRRALQAVGPIVRLYGPRQSLNPKTLNAEPSLPTINWECFLLL